MNWTACAVLIPILLTKHLGAYYVQLETPTRTYVSSFREWVTEYNDSRIPDISLTLKWILVVW